MFSLPHPSVLSLAARIARPIVVAVLEDFGGLQRVIAVAQAVELDAGGTLIVTAIEIWDHGLILHATEQLPAIRGRP
jgi:hypothetical protein